MRGAPFLNLVLAVALALMAGWLLVIGRSLLIPVFAAVIIAYVLSETSEWLGSLPVIDRLPLVLRHIILLAAFTLIFASFTFIVTSTIDDLLAAAPRYQTNLEALSSDLTLRFGLDLPPTWDDIWEATIGKLNLQGILIVLLGWVLTFGLTAFLIVVYVGFIIAERGTFAAKLIKAFPDRAQAEATARIIIEINAQIGRYLAVKTFINLVLGVLCYVILWWMDVDFALFWAVVIAFSNYIPYVGSIVGVAFPAVLSLAQFDSIQESVVLTLLLTSAQIAVGNFLDPWLVGRQLNLSPLVIIISLSIWASLWGIPGAILAIPMTSMLTIIFASFDSTRFIAVLLSERGDAPRITRTARIEG
jgi:predicted PurR-regulated permease PerM